MYFWKIIIFSKTKICKKSRIVLYFVNLFNSWHNRKVAGLSYLLVHLIFSNILFWWRYMTKIWPHTDNMVGKGRIF